MASLPAKLWKKLPETRWTLKWLAVLMALYVISYLPRSFSGSYGWGAIGTNGVKWWNWYPEGCGFSKTGQFLRFFYLPLISIDSKLWHNEERPEFKKGPIFNGWPP